MTTNHTKTESAANPTFQTGIALQELFINEMKGMFWAEQHLTDALPKMIEGANSADLKQAISNHLEQTKTHVTRLEDAFQSIGEKAEPVKCMAMEDLLTEADELLFATDKESEVRDVAIITAAQKVEHYEIASYRTLKTLAGMLGFHEVAELFGKTLEEEKMADWLLTEIENYVNEAAMAE